MDDYKWKRVLFLRPHVNEVDVDPVDLRHEIVQRIEFSFFRAPIVSVLPMVDEVLRVVEWDAVLPAGSFDLVRPARPRQTVVEVVENRFGDRDLEWGDSLAVGWRFRRLVVRASRFR